MSTTAAKDVQKKPEVPMVETIARRIQELRQLSLKALREKFRELAGYEAPKWTHHDALWRRVAWFLQAQGEGLSEATTARLAELASDPNMKLGPAPNATPIRVATPAARTKVFSLARKGASRLPVPGTQLVRKYKGRDLSVTVLEDGFAFEGRLYRTLSAIAKEVTKTHLSGRAFFHLTKNRTTGKAGGSRH